MWPLFPWVRCDVCMCECVCATLFLCQSWVCVRACLPAALIARKLLTSLPYSLSHSLSISLFLRLTHSCTRFLPFFLSSFRPSSQIVAHCMRLSFAYFNWHFVDSLAEYSAAIRYASHIAHPQKVTYTHTCALTQNPRPPLYTYLYNLHFRFLLQKMKWKCCCRWKRLRNALESMQIVEELYDPVMIREIMQIIAWYDLYK